MFTKCLTNRITCNQGDYKCYLCHYLMKESRFDAVEEHLLSDTHKEKLNKVDKEQRIKELGKLLELTEPQRKKIVENLITFDARSFFILNCHVCKCKISGLSNTLDHINGSLHKKNMNDFVGQNNKVIKQKAKKVSCDEITTNKTDIEKSVPVHLSHSTLYSNGIIYDKHNNSHDCNICKSEIIASPNISQHTQGLLHQALESKLKSSTSISKSDYIIYDEKCNLHHCTICKCEISGSPNVIQHIQGSFHQAMLEAQNLTKTKAITESASQGFLDKTTLKPQKAQQVNKADNNNQDKVLRPIDHNSYFIEIYFCKRCSLFIYTSAVLKCHILLHLYEEFDLLRNLDLIKFEIKPNQKFHLECLLCNSFICESDITCADQELEKHLKTEKHHARLALFKYMKNDSKIPAMNEQVSDVNIENPMYEPQQKISLELLCNICNVPIPFANKKEHVLGKKHSKNVSEQAMINFNREQKIELNPKKDLDYYTCFICGKSFYESSSLLQHFKQPEHQWKIISLNMINECPYIKFTEKKKLEVIECSLCKVKFHDVKTAVTHMLGRRHKKELKLPSGHLKNQENSNTKSLAQVANEFAKLSVTSTNVPSKSEKRSANSTDSQSIPVIKTKSLQKVEKTNTFAASLEELSQLGFGTENIQPVSTLNLDMVANALEDLVPLNFSDAQIKRLPPLAKPKSHRTPKIDDHRNSFAKNVLLNGKYFIKYCIDPGLDNIFNFNNEKIRLLELGVALTFPYHSERVCIPCSQQFPDDVQSLFEHLQNQEHLNNICNIQVDDKEFEKYPEQFSDLKLAKLYMHVLDETIQCHACNVKISDDDKIIRQHVNGLVHKEKSKLWKEQSEQLFNQYLKIYKDIWYYAEVFFCEICKQRCEFEIDFVVHLMHPEHMKNVYQLKVKGTNSTFDLCPSCITYWYGKTDSYEVHCKSNFHKRFAKNKDFMVPNLTITASEYLGNIDKNVDLLVSESDKVNLRKDKETALLKAIVETVKPAYPKAEAYVFGSRLSDLGFPDSDVDVFLDCENVYYTSSTKEQSQQYIKSVKSYFEGAPNTWVVDEILLPTRVPIMKLRHIPTNLKCDISFINGLSVEKSKLVGLYNRAFPICRKLILFMKKWLTLCRIFGSDYITTFSISWCVIFYLQLEGILPTVNELIKRKMESKIVDGWECGFEETVVVKSSNVSFKEHLKGFFTYFAYFNYQRNVICPYLGKAMDKNTFAYTDELPPEMDIYKKRLKNNEVEIFRFDSPMCIQDPIDLSQNLTKAVKKQQLRCFRQYCTLSAEKC